MYTYYTTLLISIMIRHTFNFSHKSSTTRALSHKNNPFETRSFFLPPLLLLSPPAPSECYQQRSDTHKVKFSLFRGEKLVISPFLFFALQHYLRYSGHTLSQGFIQHRIECCEKGTTHCSILITTIDICNTN